MVLSSFQWTCVYIHIYIRRRKLIKINIFFFISFLYFLSREENKQQVIENSFYNNVIFSYQILKKYHKIKSSADMKAMQLIIVSYNYFDYFNIWFILIVLVCVCVCVQVVVASSIQFFFITMQAKKNQFIFTSAQQQFFYV